MNNLARKVYNSKKISEINSPVSQKFFTGINGSVQSFIISYLFENRSKKIILCTLDVNKLFKLKDDINIISGNETASIYLDKYDEEYEDEITPLSSILKKLSSDENYIILFQPSVFGKPIISEQSFKDKILLLRKNTEFSFENFIAKLRDFGYTRKNIVEEENDFAVRGGIIDAYPENLNQPVRIEFFGNTIESIREFDIVTQRSISRLESTEILPPIDKMNLIQASTERLIDYIKSDNLMLIDEPDLINNEFEEIFSRLQIYKNSYFSLFPLQKSESVNAKNVHEINFGAKSQPPFRSNIKTLYSNLTELTSQGYKIFLTASDDYQIKRFRELIEDLDDEGMLKNVSYLDNSLHEGFVLPDDKIAVYTEHQVFERYYRTARRKKKFAGITFKELSAVNNGDFMVHRDFGIGKYAGLRKIKLGGVEQEAVKLLYKDNDTVFVNLNSINLIKKYSAQEGQVPKLNKLGGSEWEKIKQRTKKKIQDIARDLILLYAKRKSLKGFRFSDDNVWQKELEASFIYEDTPDQVSATDAVKEDMLSESPMDRLICGDVGFGKTEVGIRAAFKAVLDNKQAAVLVPTTILAEQHYNTFKDRLSNWAVEVEHLSRFKTKPEQKETLENLEGGKINIIIGTHRLLSKDVKFKDLGLLIIDEEQRFGVKAKEKLKFMRENVDVLTLTATPIPRTLNFSMLGARDLSIINTPPKNRQPIHTEIINMDKKIITNSITRELQRGGQVYFVNDKISKLEQLSAMIEELVPFAKVAIAHGQMSARQLEKVMMRFLEKRYNVLVCTKIIESGLDIPSVNTIIINRADNFGLAELYQLRGRVGRSNIKSFAYLITPPHSKLTKQAIRRLHALEEFSELGSGMNLALRDLEIRGAGNLLGKEQSGFIAEIGFDLYIQILDEAVSELKETELGSVIADVIPNEAKPRKKYIDVVIESDVGMLIPEWYMNDENTRLQIYQKLSGVENNEELNSIKEELADRFGKFPDEVILLFKHVELKIASLNSGFEKIIISGSTADLYFHLSEDNPSMIEGRFERTIKYINERNSDDLRLSQIKKSLILKLHLHNTDSDTARLEEVIKVLETLKKF